jgi:sorbose reductase
MADMNGGSFRHNATEAPKSDRVMPLFSLKGKTAIVSGAGAGIGLAVARGFAEAGANVAIWYNTNKKALERAGEIEKTYGVKCRQHVPCLKLRELPVVTNPPSEKTGKAYHVNITSEEAVMKAVGDVVKDFNGRLDIFVANAGIAWEDGPILDGPMDKAKKVLMVNVDGTLFCAKAAGEHFRRQKQEGTGVDGKKLEGFTYGSFIATASMSGHIVNIPQVQAVYNSSKAAVIHLCKWLVFLRDYVPRQLMTASLS